MNESPDISKSLTETVFDPNRKIIYRRFFPHGYYPFESFFEKKFYHTVIGLAPEEFEIVGQRTLLGGFVNISFTVKVFFQATLDYVRQVYKNSLVQNINDDIKARYRSIIESIIYQELLSVEENIGLLERPNDLGLRIRRHVVGFLAYDKLDSQTFPDIKIDPINLAPEKLEFTGTQTVYDGFIDISYTIRIVFQASIEYVRRVYGKALARNITEDIKVRYKHLIESIICEELLSVEKNIGLLSEANALEAQITNRVNKLLADNGLDSQTVSDININLINFVPEQLEFTGKQTIYDGFIDISYTIRVVFQASIEYVGRVYRRALARDITEDIKARYKHLIESIIYQELLSVEADSSLLRDVNELKGRIINRIGLLLADNQLTCQTTCAIEMTFLKSIVDIDEQIVRFKSKNRELFLDIVLSELAFQQRLREERLQLEEREQKSQLESESRLEEEQQRNRIERIQQSSKFDQEIHEIELRKLEREFEHERAKIALESQIEKLSSEISLAQVKPRFEKEIVPWSMGVYLDYKELIFSDFSSLISSMERIYNILYFIKADLYDNVSFEAFEPTEQIAIELKKSFKLNPEDRLIVSSVNTGGSIVIRFKTGWKPDVDSKKGDIILYLPKGVTIIVFMAILLGKSFEYGFSSYEKTLNIMKMQNELVIQDREIQKLNLEIRDLEMKLTSNTPDSIKDALQGEIERLHDLTIRNEKMSNVKIEKDINTKLLENAINSQTIK